MFSESIGNAVRQRILGIGSFLAGLGVTPNMVTLIGVLLNSIVAVIIATGNLRLGGVLLLFASAFDMLDGAVARADGKVSLFGGFFDSTLDRYSESIVYLGLLIYLLDTEDARTGAILTLVATTGSLMVSYTRARAEAAGYKASVGILARPERVIVLSLGLMLARPLWALWPLAILTHATAIARIIHVWRQSNAVNEKIASATKAGDP